MAFASRRFVRSFVIGSVLGAAGFVVAEAFRPRPGEARILDWDEIAARAHGRIQDEAPLDARRRKRIEAGYAALVKDVQEPFLRFVGGMPTGARMPPFQALDRHSWIDLNLTVLRDGLEPVLSLQQGIPNNRALDFTRAAADRYVATLLAFLAHRVLGQYDPQLLGREPAVEPGLYLVEPNIEDWQEEAELPAEPLRRWLILHEMTHAWQFSAHPWLRGYLNSMITTLIGAAVDRKSAPLDRLLGLTFGIRAQMQVVGKVQAAMSLVEGYSNLVMSVVGREQIPEFEALETAHRRRSGEKTIFERLFWRLTGLELKLQQYVIGEAFCRAVYEKHGLPALNRAWEGPETLPTIAELREPDLWLRRVRPLQTIAAGRTRRRQSQTGG